MLYTAKCFWPGATQDLVRLSALRATDPIEMEQARFQGALYLPGDELVLGLFESPSPDAVKRASEQAGMPCERVIETVWVGPNPEGGR